MTQGFALIMLGMLGLFAFVLVLAVPLAVIALFGIGGVKVSA
jgi:hypothetical protein